MRTQRHSSAGRDQCSVMRILRGLSHQLLFVSIYQYLKYLFLYVRADAFWLQLILFTSHAQDAIRLYSTLFHRRPLNWFASVRFPNRYESSISLARHSNNRWFGNCVAAHVARTRSRGTRGCTDGSWRDRPGIRAPCWRIREGSRGQTALKGRV